MSDNKKLCVVTTIESTMESFAIPSMRYFVEQGYQVTLICNMTPSFIDKYSGEFNLIPVKMERGFSLKDMLTKPFQFYRIFRREKFDYVQYATTNAAWYASFAAWMARVPVRVNCLWGLLYTASSGFKRKLFWLAEKVPCLFSNYFTVASHKNMEIAIADKLCPRSKASVIGAGGTVGVDVNVFDHTRRVEYSSSIYEKYPSLKGKTVFGYLGRIDVDKGINELLTSFINLNAPDTALLLIGPMDTLRSGLDEVLLKEAESNPNIIFTGYTKEVANHLSVVDILVHPTYREGFSMVIQQAMAMTCAIITTDIPGPSEVIDNGNCGLLVPVKDPSALTEAMRTFLFDESLRKTKVDNGLKRVNEYFTREKMVKLTFENRIKMINDSNKKG